MANEAKRANLFNKITLNSWESRTYSPYLRIIPKKTYFQWALSQDAHATELFYNTICLQTIKL